MRLATCEARRSIRATHEVCWRRNAAHLQRKAPHPQRLSAHRAKPRSETATSECMAAERCPSSATPTPHCANTPFDTAKVTQTQRETRSHQLHSSFEPLRGRCRIPQHGSPGLRIHPPDVHIQSHDVQPRQQRNVQRYARLAHSAVRHANAPCPTAQRFASRAHRGTRRASCLQ